MTDYRERLKISDLASEADNGRGIKVAVIDTGIPDVYGVPVSMAENFSSFGDTADTGHATFVGSILFGINSSIHGICTNATSYFGKVFYGNIAKPETVAAAINYAVDIWGVDVINLSLGFAGTSPCNELLRKACDKAKAKGVMVVASAGNTGGTKTFWPASLPDVLCVGSSDGKEKSSFSNSGDVDVVAPGADILGLGLDGKITSRSGTSFSTAIITGLLTLLLARRRKTDKKATAQSMRQELLDLCVDIGARGWDCDTGYGFPFPGLVHTTFIQRMGLSAYSFFDTIKTTIGKIIASLRPRRRKSYE